jgi:hypothetical protein
MLTRVSFARVNLFPLTFGLALALACAWHVDGSRWGEPTETRLASLRLGDPVFDNTVKCCQYSAYTSCTDPSNWPCSPNPTPCTGTKDGVCNPAGTAACSIAQSLNCAIAGNTTEFDADACVTSGQTTATGCTGSDLRCAYLAPTNSVPYFITQCTAGICDNTSQPAKACK